MSTWQQDLHVGVDFIDAEHEVLVITLTQLEQLISPRPSDPGAVARAGLTLERFWLQICAHFAHEERVMKDLDYPGVAEHLSKHHKFLQSLTELRDRCAGSEAEAASRWEVEYLQLWFAHHALTCDRSLAGWLLAAPAVSQSAWQ